MTVDNINPSAAMSKRKDNFITVVAVGENDAPKPGDSDFVTVLTIGDENKKNNLSNEIIEEVVVYRLPGERLGFGLKFEGGTKANEFVKRLFIQSCAPESPASRVQSSWGQLVEGDEVLEIDRMPVNTMTRIDCVRFLKDSSVAIKLMVRHNGEKKAKSAEDIPVVVSTEEKKPPPVPPRKIHRKLRKEQAEIRENIVPTIKQNNTESFFNKSSRLQSPRNSGRRPYCSPDVPRRDRRFSDGSLGPPDAEVYVDLFSQGSTQSLSESDDTGSTISTVLDRFGSFPTTTTSSFAGSLPSTPTATQRQLDLSYVINEFDDDLKPVSNSKNTIFEENNNIINYIEDDPLCFQDAPLSYGNESTKTRDETDNIEIKEEKIDPPKRPVVIPRSKPPPPPNNSNQSPTTTLPRLVDFVPKSSKKEAEDIDTLKQFLENERFDFDCETKFEEEEDLDINMDAYGSKWLISSHLATIGEEKEDESGQDFQFNYRSNNYAPLVIVESVADKQPSSFDKNEDKDIDEYSKIPPSTPRQPPDGHEFPDFIETNIKPITQVYSLPKFATEITEPIQSPEQKPFVHEKTELVKAKISLDKIMSSSNSDLCSKMYESDDDGKFNAKKSSNLHTRSQSLIDMSIFSKEKNSKWTSIGENRRKGLSKLKGLVIPEQNETDVASANIAIPEIKSYTPVNMPVQTTMEHIRQTFQQKEIVKPVIPATWSPNTLVPKYSPAFKRKSLQVYPSIKSENGYSSAKSEDEINPPKSLESIASPTKSDYSFEYVNTRKYQHEKTDESDNDSAVSSSQSSYNSRFSPPPSPDGQSRVLKPFSVEAINRKNILASAKCRSGKDFKIGSPVIQRKKEEENAAAEDKPSSLEDKILNKTSNEETGKAENVSTGVKEEERNDKIQIKETPKAQAQEQGQPPAEPNVKQQINVKTVESKLPTKSILDRIKPTILPKRTQTVDVKALKNNFESLANNNRPAIRPKPVITVPTVKPRSIETTKMNGFKISTNENTKIERNKHNAEVKKEVQDPVVSINNAATNKNIKSIELSLDSASGSLGITLAGGADYEAKDVTIHRIRYGSIAYNNGRLKKGDRIISINGKSTHGLSHAAAVELLKEQHEKYVIVVEDTLEINGKVPSEHSASRKTKSTESKCPILDTLNTINKHPSLTVTLNKDSAGLGFSIEGGKDSPNGDVPLLIKKIFTGGPADKCGQLQVGDEIIFVNNINFTNLTRLEAWSLMKKVPDGPVKIQVFR